MGGSIPAVRCDTIGSDEVFRTEAIACDTVADLLNQMVNNVNFPLGHRTDTISCTIDGFLSVVSSTACSSTVPLVNEAINGYLSGSFTGCRITTPSSTETSSATSTASSSVTSTASTTATSSVR